MENIQTNILTVDENCNIAIDNKRMENVFDLDIHYEPGCMGIAKVTMQTDSRTKIKAKAIINEEKVTECDLNFGQVIQGSKEDDWNKYARSGWNGKGMWIHKTTPPTNPFSEDKINFESIPYFEMKTVKNKFIPWTPSQEDMFAEDWMKVK